MLSRCSQGDQMSHISIIFHMSHKLRCCPALLLTVRLQFWNVCFIIWHFSGGWTSSESEWCHLVSQTGTRGAAGYCRPTSNINTKQRIMEGREETANRRPKKKKCCYNKDWETISPWLRPVQGKSTRRKMTWTMRDSCCLEGGFPVYVYIPVQYIVIHTQIFKCCGVWSCGGCVVTVVGENTSWSTLKYYAYTWKINCSIDCLFCLIVHSQVCYWEEL